MAYAFCKIPIFKKFSIFSETSALTNTAQSLHEVLQPRNRAEVICYLHDYHAIKAIMTAKALGLRLPECLGVTGFDNRIASPTLDCLTTVRSKL